LSYDPTIPSNISQTLSLALSPNSTTTCTAVLDPSPLPATVQRVGQYDGENATILSLLFRYCGDNETLDVIFPDWSFWGW
jgi:hypothetical protein